MKVGVGADGVLVGVGENVRWVVTGGCAAISSTTDVYVRSRGGILTGSALPPQATSNTAAVERRSSRMNLIFTQPYYAKRLRNGSTEATACLRYISAY